MKTGAAALEKEPKQTRTRRLGALLSLIRKLAELAAQAVQLAIKEEHRHAAEHDRIKAICELVFAGSFSRMLKNSTLLTEADREFLRGLGYL